MANERNSKRGLITHKGRVDKATQELPSGPVTVERVEKIPIDLAQLIGGTTPIPAMVPCAPYDEHFVYENPDMREGQPSFLCTCGSPAVIVNHFSPTERMFVCLLHADTGFHQTSLINSNERKGGLALGPISTSRGQKWH
jgi:hypothetical protein